MESLSGVGVQAGSSVPKNGHLSAILQVWGKGGPRLEVCMTASVVTPELRITPDAVSFSAVPLGYCKVRSPRFEANP